MKNLEQIRAAHVIRAAQQGQNFKGAKGGRAVAKQIPPHIINHGLMQTLAYAQDSDSGYKTICDNLANHLAEIGLVPNVTSSGDLLNKLAEGDSALVKEATSEALAWFNYARRLLN